MRLPKAPAGYDARNEQDTRSILEAEDGRNLKKNTRIYLGSGTFVFESPNGTQFEMSVLDTGAVVTTSL